MKKILVVEDSLNLRDLMIAYLVGQGYQVDSAGNGQEALSKLEHAIPDLMLLDVKMPKVDGYQVIRTVRRSQNVPIIMVTSKAREEDVLKGFDLGADDYIVKPFRNRELLARVRAVLRRTDGKQNVTPIEMVGNLALNRKKRQFSYAGEEIKLTPIEYRLLEYLFGSVDHSLSHTDMSLNLIEHGFSGSESAIRNHVRNLRRKIEKSSPPTVFIETVFGFGYRLREGEA